jgi:L-erythrulose 1-phosphate isomerase
MRKLWIGAGWKMNKTLDEAQKYARRLREQVDGHQAGRGINVFIVPPFTVLSAVCGLLKDSSIRVGAQNMHWEDQGAFTGEISPIMVKDCGAQLVELGHSERREFFCETDLTVNRKVVAALKHGLQPLVCVGEPAQEREYGVAQEYVLQQLKKALAGVPAEKAGEIIIAYEPVWAIGAPGVPAEPDYVEATHALIRQAVHDLYGAAVADALPILYGGSVDQSNVISYIGLPDVDGLFIGRAAWDVNSFLAIIELCRDNLERIS